MRDVNQKKVTDILCCIRRVTQQERHVIVDSETLFAFLSRRTYLVHFECNSRVIAHSNLSITGDWLLGNEPIVSQVASDD